MAIHAGARGYIPAFMSSEIVKHALPLIAERRGVRSAFSSMATETRTCLGRRRGYRIEPGRGHGPTQYSHELADFTEREIEVLKLLGAGLPNKVIAYQLSVKEGTVKVHMRNVCGKLKVSSRTQAALIATRHFVDS